MTLRGLPRIRVPRRPRQWGITHANGAIVAATHAGMSVLDLGAGLEASLGYKLNNVTVSAIRFDLHYSFQATAVIGDRVVAPWGIAIVGADARVAGGVSLPDPSADDADWIAHGSMNVVADAAAVISRPRNGHITISNNSMRKMRENNSSLVLLHRATLLDDPISIFFSGRVLFLLP